MPTTDVKTIGTGGDYTTIQAWEDACPANLTAVDKIWQGQLKNQHFTGSGPMVTFSGVTTDATRYIELTTEAGASFSDNVNVLTNALRWDSANGAAITSTGNYSANAAIMNNNQTNVRLTGLQVRCTGLSMPVDCGPTYSGGSIVMDRCIIEGKGTTADGVIGITSGNSPLKNSVFVQRSTGSPLSIGAAKGALYNCLLVATGTAPAHALRAAYGSRTLKNCGIFGATAMSTGSTTTTFTACYTDIASPPAGCTTTAYSTSTGAKFTSITDGTHDFRPQSGSSLIDVVTADTTNAPTDIKGYTRPTAAGAADVGPWEVPTANASELTGTIALSDVIAAGTLATMASSMTGAITLADSIAAGSLGVQAGVITTPVVKNWSGIAQVAVNIPKILIVRVSDMAAVASFTNQATNGSGQLVISDPSIVPGTMYLVVTCNADGTAFGCEPLSAV